MLRCDSRWPVEFKQRRGRELRRRRFNFMYPTEVGTGNFETHDMPELSPDVRELIHRVKTLRM